MEYFIWSFFSKAWFGCITIRAVHTFALHLYEKPVSLPVGKGEGLVPQAVNDIIMKCLEKDREDRWLSANQLKQALKDIYKF